MARRSATNARYQKYQEPAGQTRKSAAAAKPKRSSSSVPAKKSGTAAKGKGSKSTARRPLMVNPTTPEFQRIRKIWWGLLLGGLVLTTVSWAIRAYLKTPWAITASNVVLGIAYAAIFYALYLDWTKMRPMRQAAYQTAKSGKSEKSSASTTAPKKSSAKADKAADTADGSAEKTTDTTDA